MPEPVDRGTARPVMHIVNKFCGDCCSGRKAGLLTWNQDAIHRYYGETNLQTAYGQRSTGESTYASTLLRRDFWFGQEHGRGSPVTHSRHMRPLCELVSSGALDVAPPPTGRRGSRTPGGLDGV